ncbi:hypothetical protein [Photobacterium sp. GB-56]|uniref:hypothetical protein n=1 Tax=Photobacterium sp. GB-56 TaxID=2022106 RepID=UPI000D185E5A|nr:hypothetical protein [Photobacterium sp. GB-56]PSV27078.1 hypothetical protein C9J42_09430 [Photobacterium sp. GB-56]
MQLIFDFFPFLNGLLHNGEYLSILLLVLFTILINSKKIVSFVRDVKKHRLTNINLALSDERLPTNMKSQLTSELSIEYFSLIHGVRLSIPMFNAIHVLNDRVKQSVAFRHFIIMSKLHPSLKGVEIDSYRIRLTILDYFTIGYNALLGILILSFGASLLISLLVGMFQSDHISFLLLSIFLILLGGLLLREARPFLSVHFINDALDENQKTNK